MESTAPTTETDCSLSLMEGPSQLEEVTFQHDATFSDTLRSPNGPMRGRSVKEFEDQLTNLKKDNFNLKLRIYFLEEKMGTNFTLDKDNVVKKYIELQVDYANLKKEMDEKQELLCQAVKAMELEDEEHKKYVAEKEDLVKMYQQEIQDLRLQLQDVKYETEDMSAATDATGSIYNKFTNGSLVSELQEKVKSLENELYLEKENNAPYQLLIGQSEHLKLSCESMKNELDAKEELIQKLRQENEFNHNKIQTYIEQINNFQEKLDFVYKDNQNLNKQLVNEIKKYEELSEDYQELKTKYVNTKTDLERELKKSERAKSAGESRVSTLEAENEKLKCALREHQAKLENAFTEIRKNQNLAVSNSLPLKSNKSQTDVGCLSVEDAAAPAGTPQKDPLHVQIVPSSKENNSSFVNLSLTFSSPDKFNLTELEELLREGSQDKILSAINSLKTEFDAQRQKLLKLKAEQIKACAIIKNMIESRNKTNEELNQYKSQCKNLERELESVVSKPTSDGDSLASTRERISLIKNEKSPEEVAFEEKKMVELYKIFTDELENKIQVLEATIKEKDKHMERIREEYEELLNMLELKEESINVLESKLMANGSEIDFNQSCSEKSDYLPEKRNSFYKKELEAKDKEIDRLSEELKKCSCYLQEIVNKELWEKNKEIEKLHSRQVNSQEMIKLKKELAGKDQELKLLKELLSDLGFDPTKSAKDLKSQDKCNDLSEKLENRITLLESQLEKSEKLRHESSELCTIFGARLEELAVFLDSLLKQKSVLGILGIQKERKLREIVNNSLDLSKSFNMSLILHPDQSLISNLSFSNLKDSTFNQDITESYETLSIVPGNVTLTYQSHLYKQKKTELDNEEVLTALRQQVANLKSEIKLRDNELNKLNTSNKLSDTECGNTSKNKEVSKLTLTPQKANNTSATLKYQSECASESEGWSEPDRAVSRARIGLSQNSSPSSKTVRLSESTDDDNLTVSVLYNKRQELESCQEVYNLKTELEKKTQQLEEIEQKLLEAVPLEIYEEIKSNLRDTENKLKEQEKLKLETEEKISALKEEINKLQQIQEVLKEESSHKDKEIKNILDQLEVEKNLVQEANSKLQEIAERCKIDQNVFESKEKEFKELQNQLKNEIEEKQNKLKELESVTTIKILEMEEIHNKRIKEIENNYISNYVKKSEIEPKMVLVEKLTTDLNKIMELSKSYEDTIQNYKKREQDLNKRILDYQEKVNNLSKHLDKANLENSETTLQMNKLTSEKFALEQELNRYNAKNQELKQKIKDMQSEMNTEYQNFQQELSLLQKQKSELQLKISLLENNNAQLHNRVVRNHEYRQDFSNTLPNIKIESGVTFNRQYSHNSFQSEDILQEFNGGSDLTNQSRAAIQPERMVANASPDLGIESDQGRFSSLETHMNNVSRPLLQTLELTESMSNMLDPLQNNYCGDQDCTQRTTKIVKENSDLKKMLMKMKRTLEETVRQLNLANQCKKEVEKKICKEIKKTNQVLRRAKANLDSGSDNDVLKM